MSDEHNDSQNSILSIIGKIFIFVIPAALIVMLGVVGAAFLNGAGVQVSGDEKPVATVAAAPAVTTTAAPAVPTEGAQAASTPAAAPASSADAAQMELGKASYMMCAACHGPDGTGLKAGPMLMAPSMVGSEMLLGDPDVPLLVVLKGIQKEGMDFMGMMAPLGAALDDEKLAAVLTYTRNSWGNSAPAVTVEQAAAARAKFADVDSPAGVKRAEILKIVEAHK